MKNHANWQPSKYVYEKGKLLASRDLKEVSAGSRLIADLIAAFYDMNLKEHASGKLLDLGCGKVPLYIAYKDYVRENICVDWENTLHKNEYLDFECDLSKNLPFQNGEFNTIVLSDVLEHIPQPENLWNEMVRILASKGKLIMNVPFYYWLHERPHDYYRYTQYGLQRFVENSGLKLLLLEPIGGSPEILADMIAKHLQLVPLIGRPLAILLQSVVKFFVGTAIGEKISKKTAEVFPFGYFLIAEKA